MLRFSLFGIPVSVHVTFLFIAVLGMTAYSGFDIVLWVVAAFVSILLHEMGHALTARAFGASGVTVTLYGLGGLTNYKHSKALGHGRSFIIAAAGSATGIIAGGLLVWIGRQGAFVDVPDGAAVLIESFIFTALVWGILNWVPIVPLDGGHMVQSLAAMVNEEKAPLIGQVVTWITVAIVAPIALMNGFQFAAIIVVLFALSGMREYRASAAAAKAAERARKEADGLVAPDEIRPVPPADPSQRPPEPMDPTRREPPEFPI